jgi:hypothetical protein
VRPNSTKPYWIQTALCVSALAGCLLTTRTASAEITVVKNDTWEVYIAGRVNAFLSYAFGDAYPVPLPPSTKIVTGGGFDDSGLDLIPRTDATGMPDMTQQGTISRMRVRSGFIPNVLTLGMRRKIGSSSVLRGQVSVWGHIEPDQYIALAQHTAPRPGGRDAGIAADFREGYMELEGPWGTFTGGRFLTLFSRGITETDFLYGHGYGLGYPMVVNGDYLTGSSSLPGPTSGMIGFGVVGATFSPGLVYSTPSLGGLKLAAGVFDPVKLARAGWGTTRTPRGEGELTFDLTSGTFKMHLFGNGAFQKLYNGGTPEETTMYGAGYGGRVEVGPVHLGGGGHYGKGVGLSYAFEGSPTSSSAAAMPPDALNPLRTFSGFAVFAQVVAGRFDLNLGYGQTKVQLVDADLTSTDSVLKTQTAISAGVVYHITENFHLDVDFLNAAFAWYGGEQQKVNFLNTGVTVTF